MFEQLNFGNASFLGSVESRGTGKSEETHHQLSTTINQANSHHRPRTHSHMNGNFTAAGSREGQVSAGMSATGQVRLEGMINHVLRRRIVRCERQLIPSALRVPDMSSSVASPGGTGWPQLPAIDTCPTSPRQCPPMQMPGAVYAPCDMAWHGHFMHQMQMMQGLTEDRALTNNATAVGQYVARLGHMHDEERQEQKVSCDLVATNMSNPSAASRKRKADDVPCRPFLGVETAGNCTSKLESVASQRKCHDKSPKLQRRVLIKTQTALQPLTVPNCSGAAVGAEQVDVDAACTRDFSTTLITGSVGRAGSGTRHEEVDFQLEADELERKQKNIKAIEVEERELHSDIEIPIQLSENYDGLSNSFEFIGSSSAELVPAFTNGLLLDTSMFLQRNDSDTR